jgi:hypothetical protein
MRVIGGGIELQEDRKTSKGKRRSKKPYKKPNNEPLIIQKASRTMLHGDIDELSSDEDDPTTINAPNVFGKREEHCNGDPEKITMITNLQDEKNETKMKGTAQREITIIDLSSETKTAEDLLVGPTLI